MMTIVRRVASVTLLLVAMASVAVLAKSPDPQQILRSIDKQSVFPSSDFSAVMTMISEDPKKGLEKTVVNVFRRDKDSKFLLLIQEPKVQRGQGYLRVDDSLWFYDPESRKFTHTSMKENFSGTDVKNSDFSQSTLAKDYTAVGMTTGKLGAYEVYVLDLEATNDEVTYPYLKIWVTRDTSLVLKSEEYSLSKRLLRTSLYPSYARVGQAHIPTTMVFSDELVKGKKTQISIKDISLDRLPDSVFTKAYMERVNR